MEAESCIEQHIDETVSSYRLVNIYVEYTVLNDVDVKLEVVHTNITCVPVWSLQNTPTMSDE